MSEDAVDDERAMELASIAAIYPELVVDSSNPHSASLDVEVAPKDTFSISFKLPQSYALPTEAAESPPSSPSNSNHLESHRGVVPHAVDVEVRKFTYLPYLHLDIRLPKGYPNDAPPKFTVTVQPPWLPLSVLERLNRRGKELWEEYGHGQVIWLFIDELQQEADNAFGLSAGSMVLPYELKVPMWSFDTQEKRRKFERNTFDCGVCLEPKKGSACYRMRHCGHVFCVSCLQDFYSQMIAEGDVDNVKCLDPDCGSKADGKPTPQPPLHPSELLDIPIERTTVQRYVDMKVKKILEADTSTLYCPRRWCQAPALNPKYDKYRNATIEDFPEDNIEEISEADKASNQNDPSTATDRLSICSKCAYAFCRQCLRSWHGDHVRCRPPDLNKLTEEEMASYNYIRRHTSPCPTCDAPVQKVSGCNHMQCRTCRTHFCYLCSSWLDAQNPYKHFNTPGTPCDQRLFELEEGDNGDDEVVANDTVDQAGRDRQHYEELMMRFADEIQDRMGLLDDR